jgi:outer membrane translocation and assembly module TamA
VNTACCSTAASDPVNSLRGTFSSVSYEETGLALGADASYRKLLAQQYFFMPFSRVVLASRVVAGGVFGEDDPPAEDLFYAGGGNSVRGYAENALGPRDLLGQPLGGKRLLVLNQEVRFPIFRWLRGVGFLDAGNVLYPEVAPAENGLKVGYGVGLRFDSPVGLLRVDFGIPGSTLSTSSRSANQLSSGRWYFGIGHVF